MWLANSAPALMCLSLGVLIALGVPVAFALAATGIVWLAIGDLVGVMDGALFGLIPSRIFGVISNEVLLAIPFFTFMGFVLERAGIAEDVLRALTSLLGRVRGGLAIAVVLVGAVLAATTGVVAASVTAIGLLALPLMLKQGYSPSLTAGTIAASGTLAQIIPPSIVLIVLAEQLGVSVGDIYAAAIIPSLALVALYIAFILGVGLFRPAAMPPIEASGSSPLQPLWNVFGSLLLPGILILVVLGSVLVGIATATESGALGAIAAVALGLLRRRFTLVTLRQGLDHTVQLTSAIVLIVIGSTIFALAFYAFSGHRWVAGLLSGLEGDPRSFLLLAAVAIFFLSFFLDFFEIAFVVVPLLLPVAQALHIDLVWFGVLIGLVIQTAFLHPPFGIAVYSLKSVAERLRRSNGPVLEGRHIYIGVTPFIFIQLLLVVALVVFVGPRVEPVLDTQPLRLQLEDSDVGRP
jgi:tripartite ATP-independent transporter DctM subunit